MDRVVWERIISSGVQSGMMADLSSLLYIVLLIVFIATVPLTWLAKHAWRSKVLFLIFAGMGLTSFIVLSIMIWMNY